MKITIKLYKSNYNNITIDKNFFKYSEIPKVKIKLVKSNRNIVMMSYCVKQKKMTNNVPGSETYSSTRNGRRIMKSKCVECGFTKTRFVKSGSGLILGKNSPFKNIPVLGDIL